MRRTVSQQFFYASARSLAPDLSFGRPRHTKEANGQRRCEVVARFTRDGERHVSLGVAYLDAAWRDTRGWRQEPGRMMTQAARRDAMRSAFPELREWRVYGEPDE